MGENYIPEYSKVLQACECPGLDALQLVVTDDESCQTAETGENFWGKHRNLVVAQVPERQNPC